MSNISAANWAGWLDIFGSKCGISKNHMQGNYREIACVLIIHKNLTIRFANVGSILLLLEPVAPVFTRLLAKRGVLEAMPSEQS
ncbi:Uncharacterised protein [Pseudomonas putida]|nr:hypothetical protein SAMN05216307_0575 [Pseudomonas putida]SMQ03900.1 hypothetical protein SAMN05216380_4888 [Pseudomonas putida]VEE42636.1 Uncharacterised protein [Pseudomonas putida]VTQ27888.1 Uncharacterised protein [Pseudomonas putida]